MSVGDDVTVRSDLLDRVVLTQKRGDLICGDGRIGIAQPRLSQHHSIRILGNHAVLRFERLLSGTRPSR